MTCSPTRPGNTRAVYVALRIAYRVGPLASDTIVDVNERARDRLAGILGADRAPHNDGGNHRDLERGRLFCPQPKEIRQSWAQRLVLVYINVDPQNACGDRRNDELTLLIGLDISVAFS